VIRVPERDVVFTGDLLFHRAYLVALDADMIVWRRVLDRFSRYSSKTRITGHGPICRHDTVREQAAVLDDLRAHAERMIRAGASADEAGR
jgi:glyoxylase-like metal-dependent hydrolase (beta-lactamase superfamily II)